MKKRRTSKKKRNIVAGSERRDMIRYMPIVGVGIVVCVWMWWTQPLSAKAALIYSLMAVGSLAGYVLFRWKFPVRKS